MNAYEVRPKKTDKSEAKYQAHQIILTLDLTASKFDDHLRILNLEIQTNEERRSVGCQIKQ